jgi:hypothetical protein
MMVFRKFSIETDSPTVRTVKTYKYLDLPLQITGKVLLCILSNRTCSPQYEPWRTLRTETSHSWKQQRNSSILKYGQLLCTAWQVYGNFLENRTRRCKNYLCKEGPESSKIHIFALIYLLADDFRCQRQLPLWPRTEQTRKQIGNPKLKKERKKGMLIAYLQGSCDEKKQYDDLRHAASCGIRFLSQNVPVEASSFPKRKLSL